MTKRHTPPGRKSYALVVVEKPSGPHHCARCSGSIHAVHTSSRGASSTRVAMIDRGSCSRSRLFLALTLLLLGLHYLQIILQAVEAFLPQPAIALEPGADVLEGVRLDAAGPPLRLAASRDEAGTLQHLEVLGDGGEAHLEGLGQLGHRGLAQRQPREDGPTRGIGEGCEGGTEAVDRHDVMYQLVK